MFSNEEYQEYIERLKAISEPGYEMKQDDYYLVKRFKISRKEINGKIYNRLVKFSCTLCTFKSICLLNYLHKECI
jgi:hypothetical protein